jgi:hypothetical protein
LSRSLSYGENNATEEIWNMGQRCGHGVDIIYESRLSAKLKAQSAKSDPINHFTSYR